MPDTMYPADILRALDLAPLGNAPMYFEQNDNLRLRVFNSAAGVTLAVEGRFLQLDGRIVPIQEQLVPATDRTMSTKLLNVGEGFLMNVAIRALAGSPRRGQCWAVLELVRGLTGDIVPLWPLVQDYVTDTSRVGWPGALIRQSAEGPGCIRSILGTNPAAAAEISETVPTNARWRLISFYAALVTDVNAATRVPSFVIDDGANIVQRMGPPSTVAASTVAQFLVGPLGYATNVSGFQGIGLSSDAVLLQGGFRIRTITSSMQVGDDWSAPQLLVEEWIED